MHSDRCGIVPAVRVELIEGAPTVVVAAAETGLKPGMELLGAEGIPVKERMARDVYPYVSASTRQGLELQGMNEVFPPGEFGTTVDAVFADLDGKRFQRKLTRGGTLPKTPEADFRLLADGIACLVINTFRTDTGARAIDANLDRLLQAKALIIDVRENGGGNTGNGDAVLSRLIDKTLPPDKVARYRTRAYKAAFRAMGRPEEWFEGDHGSIEPFGGKRFLGPVVALIGPKTGSAAEDFIVALAASKRATLIGSPTNGSTGQPLTFHIYGASVGICTKWNMFPDGAEFVGVTVAANQTKSNEVLCEACQHNRYRDTFASVRLRAIPMAGRAGCMRASSVMRPTWFVPAPR